MAVVKLRDKDFLEDYVCFAVWQPAIFSTWLTNQLSDSGGFNKAAALQIYLNFEVALEMLAMWYFALLEWKPGHNSLAHKFTRIKISGTQEHPYNVEQALASLAAMQPEQVLSSLKQPSEKDLEGRGWMAEDLKNRQEVARKLPELIERALKNRSGSNADLVRAYNKLKHGLLVFQELPGQSAEGVALVKKVTSGGLDAVNVEPIWLSDNRDRLKAISEITVTVCQLAAALLAVLPWFYFSQDDWQSYKAAPSATGSMIKVWQRLEEMRKS